MRSIPAVSLACRDGGAWRAVVFALHGFAAGTLMAWLAGPGWAVLCFGGSLLTVLVVLRLWQPAGQAPPVLAWDGQAWQLDGAPGRPGIALDVGVWMLLCFDGDGGGRRWLPVSAAAGAWTAWRAALVASAGPQTTLPDPRAAG
jgi:hypothetical protein